MTKNNKSTHAERVQASRLELKTAESEHKATAAALADAEDALNQIEQARRNGNRSTPVEDAVTALMTAETRVRICRMDKEASEARVRRAQRGLVNDDTTLADAVAAPLRDLSPFGGYNVVATAEDPGDAPETITKPTLYVIQPQAPVLDLVSGRASGLVTLRLRRPDWGQPLDVDDLPEALAPAQVYVDTHPVRTGGIGPVRQDETPVSVRGVWPSVPVIQRPGGESRFGQVLAGLAAKQAGRGFQGELRGTVYGALSSSSARMDAVHGQSERALVSNVAEANGERRATLEVVLAFRSSVVGGQRIVESVREYLATQVGTAWDGLGRAVSVDRVTPLAHETHKSNAPVRIRAEVTFLSATP